MTCDCANYKNALIFRKGQLGTFDKFPVPRIKLRCCLLYFPHITSAGSKWETTKDVTYEELIASYPDLLSYTRDMPEVLNTRFTVRHYPANSIIHQKDEVLKYFVIVCHGQHRVINELLNGHIFMIEKNKAISFLGEVALLGGYTQSSVTIETITDCIVITFSIEDFEHWLQEDRHFLRQLCQHVSRKLYNVSYRQGERQYYSVRYVLMQYLIDQSEEALKEKTSYKKSTF